MYYQEGHFAETHHRKELELEVEFVRHAYCGLDWDFLACSVSRGLCVCVGNAHTLALAWEFISQ